MANKQSQVCGFLDLIFGRIVKALASLDLQDTINIFRIDKDCAWLDISGKYKLYGIKIENSDNTIKHFGKQIEMMLPSLRFAEHSDAAVFFVNKDNHQAVYLFAFDGRIISQLSKDLRMAPLTGEGVTSALLDVLLAQKYTIKNNRSVLSGFATKPFIPYGLEMASGKFREKAMLAVDNIAREYTIYQGEEYESIGDFSPIDLFRAEWEGVFGLWINFSASAAESKVAQYESVAKFSEKDFAAECRAILKTEDEDFARLIKEQSYVVNSILILKEEKSLNQVSAALNIQFNKNYRTGPKIVAKTLLMSRDSGFDTVLPTETILRFMASSHKTPTPPEFICDFAGVDISGNFIDYSFANNDNPHALLTGKTGSGKSVQAIGILEGILGYSHATTKASNFHNVKIRYADIGYTSGKIVEKLKDNYPQDVEIFGSDVSTLRFGLFDFDLTPSGTPPEEEVDFLTNFTSFALDIEGVDPLIGLERSFMEESIRDMFVKFKTNDMFVEDLMKRTGYDKILAEIHKAGFSRGDKLRDLGEEFEFLSKPSLQQLLEVVTIKANNGDIPTSEKEVYQSLLLKLKVLNGNNMINFLPNMRLAVDKQFFHIDFDQIKDNPRAFNISYWMIMKRWLKAMIKNAIPKFKEGLPPETVFFFIEEAHNFFKYKTFEAMLKTAAKEVRKFGGRLFFITQDIYDMPEAVSQEISTKMFISSASEKERYKKIAANAYPQADMGPINEVIDYLGDRMLLILSDRGVVTCKLNLGPDMLFYKPKKIG